eukprot:4908820-Pleurochrysis_carterae.AAC.2
MEIADDRALPGLLVDAHDVFCGGPGVHQVRRMRVYVPRAPTVDDQGQAVVGTAASFQPVMSAGE